MRFLPGIFAICLFVAFTALLALAQRPGGEDPPLTKSADAADLVSRMMKFDKNKDGVLTKEEVSDERLHRLFDRADSDKNGKVTRSELTALAEKEHADEGDGPPGFGPGGPPRFGPPPGGGPGGSMFGPPRPGEILPRMLQQLLKLSPEQRAKLEDLQKEVDERLDKILNNEQKKQLWEMRNRGPGRFGPPGGIRPRDFGGPPPGGPPPGSELPGE
jgi:hypothetical protein